MARRMPAWDAHGPIYTPLDGGQDRAGHLYYVRLTSGYGTLYKIGYTSLASVKARLTYAGPLIGCSIDRVLLFRFRSDAERLEQQLHRLLRRRACFAGHRGGPQFPLFGNGQSELYDADVLGLDSRFRPEDARRTSNRLELHRMGVPVGSLRAVLLEKLWRLLPEEPLHDRAVADLVARAGLSVGTDTKPDGSRGRTRTEASGTSDARTCAADEVSASWLDEVVAERKAAQAETMARLRAIGRSGA